MSANASAGRLATIGIVIERSSDPALIGRGSLLYVEDSDAIDAARPDRVTYALVDRLATRRCTARRLTPLQTLVSGNVVVEDSADADPGHGDLTVGAAWRPQRRRAPPGD